MEGAEAQEKHRVWRAIMVLVFFTFLHSYVGVSLYAYAGFMVVDLTGGSRNGAGYMTGFMASSSYLGRFLSSCVWGHVADCLGRKPVMIISLTSMLIFPVTFGLARSVDWAVTTRLLLGLTCPGHIVIRTLTPEVAGSSRVVQATGYVSGAIGFAMAVGPAIGGLLAQPTNHFPAIFPSDGLFARYPYLLPNLVSTPLVVICMLLAILFVPETMAATRKGSYGRRPSKSLGRKEYLEVVPTSAASPWATPTPRKPDAKGNGEGLNRVPGGDRSTPGGFVSPSCVGKFLSPAHLRSRTSPLSSRARSRVTPPHQATTPATPVGRFSRTPQSGSRQASPHAWGVSITLPPSAHVELPVTPPGSECDVGDGKDLGDDESPDPVTKPTRGGWQLPRVISAVCGTGLMELILTSFDEVYPLWAMSTRDVGGLNWDMVLVGKVFFVSGMVHFLYMFVGYNWIAEKVGVARAHRAAGIVSVVLSAAVPFIGYLDWSVAGIFTISLVLVTLINSTSFMLYNAMVMASTSSVPPKLRGKIAGLMSTGVGLGGFLGPFALSIAFAWSISTSFPASETPLVNQHSAFNVGAILRALLLMLLWKDLTEENLTGVVNDVPVPESLPSLELESIHEDHSTESPGTLAMGNRRVDLV